MSVMMYLDKLSDAECVIIIITSSIAKCEHCVA